MLEKLDSILAEINELNSKLSDPNIHSDIAKVTDLNKKFNHLKPLGDLILEYRKVQTQIIEDHELIDTSDDYEMVLLAKQDLEEKETLLHELEEKLKIELIPKDKNDDKDIIVEIRAGAGGDESSLFASELFRMYSRYADTLRYKVELIDASISDSGGFKEVVFSIKGDKAYSLFKYESGVHRVQRIPVTESQGRIHTSTVTVAVLPEATEVDLVIKPEDLRIDVFRSSGPGGQSVNTTDSAVRILHLPTGLIVSCQDEKSQLKNKVKAMSVLRSKLLQAEEDKLEKERGDERRSQIGSGDRSEKIKTYNFPQDRLTDHRIKVNWSNLPKIMEGDLDDIMKTLIAEDNKRKLS